MKRQTITVQGKKALERIKAGLRDEGTEFSYKRHGAWYKIYPK